MSKTKTATPARTKVKVAKPKKREPPHSKTEQLVVKPKKYDPHTDGKGPPLTGAWKEQISKEEVPSDHIKISTWNVNGLKSTCRSHKNGAEHEGDFQAYLAVEKPDIICLNETKIGVETASGLEEAFPDFTPRYVHSQKAGYAGVAIFIRKESNLKIEKVLEGIGDSTHDEEGRNLAIVFPGVVLVTTYVANSGDGLKRLDYRIKEFDLAVHHYLDNLALTYRRPVVWTGDLNCAREEIDIWNSKANQKSAGHTPEERASLTAFLDDGIWVDIWRLRNPNHRAYTFWPMRSPKARVENLGWRLDYFIVSRDIVHSVGLCEIRDEVQGSDHCPIVLSLPKNLFV